MSIPYRRHILLAVFAALTLAACGTPATFDPTLPATLVYPARVAILPPGITPSATKPPTATLPASATPVPVTPTTKAAAPTAKVFATATKVVTAVPGDPQKGQALFANGTGDPSIPACSTCHYTDKPDVKVGPSLQGVASRAGIRVQGQDAWTYLEHSIKAPNEYLVQSEDHVFSTNGTSLMHQTYATELSQDQINDIVAYLLTLK